MIDLRSKELQERGFLVIPEVFSKQEIAALISLVETSTSDQANFRKTQDLFAIRNVLGEIPALGHLIRTTAFQQLVRTILGTDYFNTKAIYFDKPPLSNWSVAWHQDTTISVDRKMEIEGFGSWTLKQGLTSVQPTLAYLENMCAIRIHLDDCDPENGALKVVPSSHLLGSIPDAHYTQLTQNAVTCPVPKGGIMFMKPLLLHASHKSVSERNRRVIHLEFSSLELPMSLQWRERVFHSSIDT